MISPTELVTGFVYLNSLPELVIRLNRLIDDPGHTAADLGQVIELDPALSARLLKIVNSPLYGMSKRIDSISRAIAVIGENDLRDLALATTVAPVFSGIRTGLVDVDTFWRHSVYCAVVARQLAELQRLANRERYFLAGLLHDVGSLLIYDKLPEMARETLLRSRHHSIALYQAEHEVLGFDHAAVGAALLAHWQLPDSLVSAVGYHHAPEDAVVYQEAALVVHVANCLANTTGGGKNSDAESPALETLAGTLAGLSVEAMEQILVMADNQFEAASAFVLGSQARRSA